MRIRKIVLASFCLSLMIISLPFPAQAMAKPAIGTEQPHQVFLGVFREGAPRNMNYINNFVKETGKKPAMILWYADWSLGFPAEDVKKVLDYGAAPQIVWEAFYWSDRNKVKIKDVVDGKWDNYIRSWAKAVKEVKQPVFLRIGHEFNVDIYPWGVGRLGQDSQNFIGFYRHVVDIFKQEGVKNVKWVWAFNNYSNPKEAWNDWTQAYPGDSYVDWIGIDGYNWGKTQSWSGWEDFKGLFREQMRLAKKLWPSKPIMAAEFASTEIGGDKALWIKDLPGYLKTSMRDIDAIVWFDVKKESDWRIKSSPKSLAAFQEIMKDQLFSSSGEALANFTITAPSKAPKVVYAAKAPANLKIDGNLADWNKTYPLKMQDESYFKEGLTWKGLGDLSGITYLMWDEENLYVAAEINDKIALVNNQSGPNIWNGDALEIVLGLNHGSDPKRSSFERGDFQMGLATGDGKKNPADMWNWQRRRSPGGEIIVKKQNNPDGYILEAKIPWQSFKAEKYFTPAAGSKIPFDIAFDDADSSGVRERQFIWSGDYLFYKDPSVWGSLELK